MGFIMSILSTLALATILDSSTVSHDISPMKDLSENQVEVKTERYIGVANPLPANAEDKSDNVYKV